MKVEQRYPGSITTYTIDVDSNTMLRVFMYGDGSYYYFKYINNSQRGRFVGEPGDGIPELIANGLKTMSTY